MSENRNSLYVTLPSNGSPTFYPNNKAANYKNKLGSDLDLEGCWEVGLAEIQYQRSWNVLKDDGCLSIVIFRQDTNGTITTGELTTSDGINYHPLTLRYGVSWNINKSRMNVPAGSIDILHIDFAKGNYSTPEMIAEYVKNTINRGYNTIAPLKDAQGSEILDLMKVHYDNLKKRIMLKSATEHAYLIFYENDSMAALLGFPTIGKLKQMMEHKIKDWLVAPNAPSAYNTPALYIYTDIIAQEHVGQDLVQLLRTVPVSGNHGEIVCRVFEKAYYKRVLNHTIASIEIQVNDDTGALIDFAGGKVICVLHFRRCI